MKYTGMQFFGKKYNKKFKIFTMFVIVLPIVAIMTGAAITKLFIIPYTNRSAAAVNNTESQPVNKINNSYSIYYIQTGAFTNIDNAELLTRVLNDKGISSVCILDKDIYRVINGISNENNFKSIIDKLNTQGYNAIVNEYTINRIDNNKPGDDIINEYLINTANLIDNQLKYQNKQDREAATADSFKKDVDYKAFEASKIESSGMDESLIKSLKACDEIVGRNAKEFIINYSNKEYNAALKNLANEIFAVKSLYDVVSQLNIK